MIEWVCIEAPSPRPFPLPDAAPFWGKARTIAKHDQPPHDHAWTIAATIEKEPPRDAPRVLTLAGFIWRVNGTNFLVKQIADDTYVRQTPALIG